jgi:putative transposase
MHKIDKLYTNYPFFGSRRMTAMLNRMGHVVNRKRVRRLLAIMGISAIYPMPHLSTPDKEHVKYPYLLRGVPIERLNQVWGVDITYLALRGGFAYLVAFIDWYSRYVLSFAVSTTLDHQFCIDAFNDALRFGSPEIVNSDQGVQFTCKVFVDAVLASKARVSMDGRGRALDNVFTERLWWSAKHENVYILDYHSPREAFVGLTKYFSFYNNIRPHQSLGYETPGAIYNA